jgi:hypothetical protein
MLGRRGFSLITVLLISLVMLVMAGAAMQMVSVNAGSGRTVSAINRKYNFLVGEVEKTRGSIIERLDINDPLVRTSSGMPIISADNLLLSEDRRELSQQEMNLYGMGRGEGVVSVKVFDMQYDGGDVSPAIDPAEMSRLPPALVLSDGGGEKDLGAGGPPDDTGASPGGTDDVAYLIRASLEVDGVPSGTIDMAILGRPNDSPTPPSP